MEAVEGQKDGSLKIADGVCVLFFVFFVAPKVRAITPV